ncbi:MAG: protein translocase subunit SecD [Alphaproteobacteria bacterium]|nr:protein translocase subunit SecD [Alphaproteobacteria bacterium]
MVYFARWKMILVAAISLFGLIYLAPNFISREAADAIPSWLPHKQINLGLDLRGGAHLLLEAEVEEAIKERLNAMVDAARVALRNERIGYTGIGRIPNGVGVTIRNAEDVSRARSALRTLEQGMNLDETDGRITLTLTEERLRDLRSTALQQSIQIVSIRVNESGLREPTIQSQGSNRILVQLPGVRNAEEIIRLIGKTAKLSFHLVDDSVPFGASDGRRAPPGSMYVPSNEDMGPDGRPIEYLVSKRALVTGDMLVDSQPTIQDGQPVVSFRFDAIGARRFGDVTRRNVGKPFAIVLDNQVISAPVIREAILGGNGIISGNFTTQSARDLALLLRSGALPVPISVVEQRTVGPDLGADSIRAGEVACVLALVVVIVFMAMTYGLFGLMADVALLLNIVLIGAMLSVLQATLTLPGIAGIVLTIGMAVDANVLVFERIREEERAGRTPISAVDAGYQRAFKTIIDANVTTLIAAVLLYLFGSGPVRGFAVTLSIGIVTSMFSAIMVTRLMVVLWLRRRRPQKLPV